MWYYRGTWKLQVAQRLFCCDISCYGTISRPHTYRTDLFWDRPSPNYDISRLFVKRADLLLKNSYNINIKHWTANYKTKKCSLFCSPTILNNITYILLYSDILNSLLNKISVLLSFLYNSYNPSMPYIFVLWKIKII